MLTRQQKRLKKLKRKGHKVGLLLRGRRGIFMDTDEYRLAPPEFEFVVDGPDEFFHAFFYFPYPLGGGPNTGWLYTAFNAHAIKIDLLWSENLTEFTTDVWSEAPDNGTWVSEELGYKYAARSKYPKSSVNKISTYTATGPLRGMVYDPVLYPPAHEDYPSGVGPLTTPVATQVNSIRLVGEDLALPNAPYVMPGAAATLQADLVALGFPGSVVDGGTVDGEQWEIHIPSVLVGAGSNAQRVTFPGYLNANSTQVSNKTISSVFFRTQSITPQGIRTDLERQFVKATVTPYDSVTLPGDVQPPVPPVIPDPEYYIILESIPTVTTAGGTTTLGVVTDDRVEDVTTEATETYGFQLVATRKGSENEAILYTSSNPAVATVDANGLVTYVSAGNVNILATHGPFAAQVNLGMTAPTTVTAELRIYKSGAPGTARLAAEQAVDSRLAGKTKAAAVNIFTTQNHAAANYTRNEDCWAHGISGMSGISPWNSHWTNNGQFKAGTLITPRHVTFAKHYQLNIGDTMRFIAADNTVITRTLVAKQSLANTDITIALLDSDLPAEIEPVKMLPADWQDYFPTGLQHIPALCLDQKEKALVTDCAVAGQNLTMQIPTDAKRLEFYEPKIGGDSGNPALLIINDQLVMVTQWWYGGPGSGPFLPTYRTEIEAAITTLGAFGHALCDTIINN